METKLDKKFMEELRMRIRKLCYKEIGKTYNEIELFLLNRFPGAHESYWSEWIERLQNPNHYQFMDIETANVWFSVCIKCSGINPRKIPIVGELE